MMMISTKKVKTVMEEYRNELIAVIFGNDQSPGKVESSYWMKFLNQDTAVLFGTEKYAREYNMPVLFGTIEKVKRGYYTFHFKEVVTEPEHSPYGEITEKTTKLLEEEILKLPQYWLWSHRRWKHRRAVNTEDVVN